MLLIVRFVSFIVGVHNLVSVKLLHNTKRIIIIIVILMDSSILV